MILEKEVIFIGIIGGRHGLNGEVELKFENDAFDRGNADYLFLDMDGILVPFFWDEYRFKNEQTVLFKFTDVNTENEANAIKGAKVYYPLSELGEEECLQSWKSLIGFTVMDVEDSSIGTVIRVDDTSANILLTLVSAQEQEILLPFHEDLLVSLDMKSRCLHMNLPEGILDLN